MQEVIIKVIKSVDDPAKLIAIYFAIIGILASKKEQPEEI